MTTNPYTRIIDHSQPFKQPEIGIWIIHPLTTLINRLTKHNTVYMQYSASLHTAYIPSRWQQV
jgi:hypothetical protein